jgi:DNA-directed RNA polymerase subunit F
LIRPSHPIIAGRLAPADVIEITPQMIDEIALIILCADYRLEDERDDAKEILSVVSKKFLSGQEHNNQACL